MSKYCLIVRRALEVDPNRLDDEANIHLSECENCRHHARRLRKFDEALQQSARVKAPEGIADRILLSQSYDRNTDKLSVFKPFLTYSAIAAVLLLVAVYLVPIKLISTKSFNDPASISMEIIHMVEQMPDMPANGKKLDMPYINSMLGEIGMEMMDKEIQVSYIELCKLKDMRASHLVISNMAKKPLNIFVIPNMHLDEHIEINNPSWKTSLIPVNGGSIAVVDEMGSDTLLLAQKLVTAFSWPSTRL